MATYVVMQRGPAAGARPDTVFVRDDFSLLALVVPLVWLLWHRLWFAAAMLLLVSVGIGMAGEFLAPGFAMVFAGIAVNAYVALEGPAWRIARYRRDGYMDRGAVVAPDIDEAELRWFAGSVPPVSHAAPVRRAVTPPPLPQDQDMVFGFGGEAR